MSKKNRKKIEIKTGCIHHSRLDSVYMRWEYGQAYYYALHHCGVCGEYDEQKIELDDFLYWKKRGYGS